MLEELDDSLKQWLEETLSTSLNNKTRSVIFTVVNSDFDVATSYYQATPLELTMCSKALESKALSWMVEDAITDARNNTEEECD